MLPAEPMEQHLSRLRHAIASAETFCENAPARALGVEAVDAALGGGLQGATLHEVSAAAPVHLGAAAGFALALAALANEPRKQTLALAARDGGGIALLLRHKASNAPSVARTRWQIAAAPSVPDEFGGLGRTAFTLSLTRNRRGPCGNWTLTWDHHEHAFSALSVGVAAAA